MVQAIPAGYAGVTSYLIIRDAASAIDFYKKAFGATEVMRFPGPNGKVGHAELKIAGGHIMLADESPEMGHRSVQSLGGSPVSLMFYVPDVDKSFAQAVAAGGKVKHAVKDQFYGDRSGTLDRSVRPDVDDRDAQGRRLAGGDAEANGKDDGRPAKAA